MAGTEYYLKRVGQTLVVFFLATTLTFVLYRAAPGSAADMIRVRLLRNIDGQPTPEQIRQINQQVEFYTNINPERPLYLAYLDYMKQLVLHQDLGQSILFGRPVTELLLERAQWTLFISVYGLLLGYTTSLLLGAGMAYKEGSRMDRILTAFTTINRTVPFYVVALFSIIIFADGLGWFPSAGNASRIQPGFTVPYMLDIVHHAALPILASFVAGFGGALAYRGNCIRELGKGYIRVAHLRGVKDSRIAIRYVGRNSLLPIYTQFMMGLGALLGGSVILEEIFQYPGMGRLFLRALNARDYPLLMGGFLVFTALTLTGILIADLTYGLIDPRVKGGAERESF